MPTFHVSLSLSIALVFSGVALAGSYTVSVVQVPSGFPLRGMGGINNSGQVAGFVNTGTGAETFATTQAFIGSPSGATLIPLPTGWISSVALVRISHKPPDDVAHAPTRAALAPAVSRLFSTFRRAATQRSEAERRQEWRRGTQSACATSLPKKSGEKCGLAINDLGQVAGTVSTGVTELVLTPANSQAFIGTVSGSAVLPLPSGWGMANGQAINDSGQVAGSVFNIVGGPEQAFIGTASGVTLIPLPTGWSSTAGVAINMSGQVAGDVSAGLLHFQAFIGTASGSMVLPLPTGWSQAFGTAINDSGQVAGELDNCCGAPPRAFIGTASAVTVIPLPVGATSAGANGLSDSGAVWAMATQLDGSGPPPVEPNSSAAWCPRVGTYRTPSASAKTESS